MKEFKSATTQEIKKLLIKHFNFPFRVRKGRGTASHWISIHWEDGPTSEDVRKFLAQFNDDSRDDIMTDLWCGSQYTNEHRKISDAAYLWAARKIETDYGVKLPLTYQTGSRPFLSQCNDVNLGGDGYLPASQAINMLLMKTDFRDGSLIGKNKEITALLDDFTKKTFGRTATESAQKKICVACGKPVTGFRDPLSAKEYGISGLCQSCQNKVFKEE